MMLENVTYSNILLTIIVALLSIIAFRINIAFDVNKWLQDRKEKKLSKLRNLCSHYSVCRDGKNLVIKSHFESPSGTTKWRCAQCGLIVNHVDKSALEYWKNNPPELLIDAQKRFQKALRKAGYS